MQKKIVIGNATLYLGDCLDVMGELGCVDAVITDPPYEAEAHTPTRRTHQSINASVDAKLDFMAISDETRKLAARHFARLSRGWTLAFCQVEAAALWRDAMVVAGAKYRRTMVWIKPDSSPQFNGQGPAPGYECISASWCGDGRSVWNAGGKRGVYTYNCNTGRFGGHPTEKPIRLMESLISDFVVNDGVVLDPFMGSGTTGVACANLGNKFVGIEKDPKYFEIAYRRIKMAQAQERLFA